MKSCTIFLFLGVTLAALCSMGDAQGQQAPMDKDTQAAMDQIKKMTEEEVAKLEKQYQGKKMTPKLQLEMMKKVIANLKKRKGELKTPAAKKLFPQVITALEASVKQAAAGQG